MNRNAMRPLSWSCVLAVALVCGCTERNPDFCGDKTCIDPAKPYCDYYGEIAGTPGTCIAVECSPDEFAVCHGDTAITCNAEGNNYEQLQCALGCDAAAGGCRQCTKNEQCSGGLVCELASSTCRACRADDECDSRVCDLDAGTCVEQSRIVYAAPNGTGGTAGACTLAQPCEANHAISVATTGLSSLIVRMLPGSYVFPLTMDVPHRDVTVVATGANMAVLGDVAALVVDAGSTLKIRGVSSTSERHVQCGLKNTSSGPSALTITDAAFTTPGNAMTGTGVMIELKNCSATLRRSSLSAGATTILATGDDATFDGDRIRVHAVGIGANTIIGAGARSHLRLTNSTVENTNVITFFSDTSGPGSSLEFGYDTFAIDNGIEACSGTYPSGAVTRLIENSIVAASGTFNALRNASPAGCTLTSTILTYQSSPPVGAIIADPQFLDPSTYDLHLKPSSPAVDAAKPATLQSTHDVDGTARPIGVASDVGAYELQH